ncbi:MAG: serine hydrolase domain-containing protein, partial [Thermoanaerobaculia bacterium]
FTSNANSYFSDTVLKDFATGLAPLGAPRDMKQIRTSDRGGMTFRLFEVTFAGRSLAIWERDMPDGRLEQFQVMASE